MATTIGSVYTIDFDEDAGVMRLHSIVDKQGTNEQTTLATSANTQVGLLAAEASRSNNVKNVYNALRQAINSGDAVSDPAITQVQQDWDSIKHENGNAPIENKASQSEIDEYNTYKKLKKEETRNETAEKGKEVTINNQSYTIIGPFKITFKGKGISEVTAGNARWTPSSTREIYWSKSVSTTASDWSSNFNATTSGKYELSSSSEAFYLAVLTSELPDSGRYTITIKQENFNYHKARIIVCRGNNVQQTGMYCYDGSPTSVVGEATWTVERNALKSLRIVKRNKKTQALITSGVGFKVYAELEDGTTGWLSGDLDATKSYVNSVNRATEYASSVNIQKLKPGTYYVYETTIAEGYDMSEQEGYKQTATGSDSFSSNAEWVYCGSQRITTNGGTVFTFETTNKRLGRMKIVKEDEKTGEELSGARFKIYAVLDNGTSGWVTGSTGAYKNYVSSAEDATSYTAPNTITRLKYGVYYIYEVKAPTGYNLNRQDGYHQQATGSDTLTGDWVYVGRKIVREDESVTEPEEAFTVTIVNDKAATLQIVKVDETTGEKLVSARFKLYAELEDGTTGWVSGTTAGEKEYVSSAEDGSWYLADKTITGLKFGTYYIYEIKAPNGYRLPLQNGYHQTAPGSSTLTGDWAYIAKEELREASNSNADHTITATNKLGAALMILKVDEKTGQELTGAAFKLYAELADGTRGWVSGTATGTKTYGETAAEYSAKTEITNLKYGTYYVYETKAPDGYSLSGQNGYHQAAAGSSSLTGDWVYLGTTTLNASHAYENGLTVTATNKQLASAEIIKTDERTGEELTGAAFRLYAVLDDGTTGWVSGTASGDKTYGNTATEYSDKEKITGLKYGTYYMYETKAPEGYDLSEQDGYHQAAEGSNTLTGDWVYLGSRKLDENYTSNTPFTVTIPNKPLGTMEIIKIDYTTQSEIEGGKFKIYAVLNNGTSGWLSGAADGDKTYGTTATEYDSKTEIKNLKYGTYYIYETQTPTGYDITKQDGYHQAAEGSSSLTGDWVYLGQQTININFPESGVFDFTARNKKIVDELEGYVWIDEPDTKDNNNDNIYDSGTNDSLKSGITVNLYDGTGTLIATTTTDSSGYYRFTTKNAPSYTGADKAIYYWDLAQAYVEFIYNNKTTYNSDGTVREYGYVSVNPFEGTNTAVNSKAQEYTITTERLDDNNLTGTTGNNPGRAVTYRPTKTYSEAEILENTNNISQKIQNNTASYNDLVETPLTGYYNNTTYKISNINLGLLEQRDPEFDVDETLAYIKVKMKGYTYTYKYGDAAATTSTNVPTVNEQNSARTFTGKIYPTDIAYNMAEATEELQVYVVYSIDVTNTETTYRDNIYVEERLYLDSLVNTYDINRYQLCNNENNSDKSDFALWQDRGNGTASYDVNNANSVYRDGMGRQETKTAYIQFKIKEEALEKILTGGLTYEDIENAPTIATATGYHEYLRTDNAWVHDGNVRAFNGAKGTSSYPTVNSSSKKYYVHKSISKSYSSSDLYLRLSLGDPRTVTGTVFEDTRTEESANNNTNLGNGILDDNEANRANQVTVELLNADRTTVTKLYQERDGHVVYEEDGEVPDAIVTTEVGGTFTFEGVVPGYYYIRFTYGDGTQKMMPADEAIQSNDYKSTIINTADNDSIIKNAMEASSEALSNAQQTLVSDYNNENAKKLVEWYKYLDKAYSTAVDETTERLAIENYEYREDGKVYDASGNEVTDYPTNIHSYTPMLGISIENDINNATDNGNYHLTNYDEFNFGIIKELETNIVLEKKITNIDFTSQTGATIVSANPSDRTASYVTALDNITGGSKYARLEMDPTLIYGSELATTYEITIENQSAKDYIEDQNSDEFGYYYKYGEMTSTAQLKKVTINQVVDELDEKYNYDSIPGEVQETVVHEDGSTTSSTVTIEKPAVQTSSSSENTETQENPDGSRTETTNKYIAITGWSGIESQASTSVQYTATTLLSSQNDDTAYINAARITSISLDKLSNLRNNFEWGDKLKDTTTLTITPTTGEDRSNTYWIAGAIALVVLATGFVVLKKKVLK